MASIAAASRFTPELSGSKSSPSSSLRSGHFDSPDGFGQDIENFEDIVLEAPQKENWEQPAAAATAGVPAQHPSLTGTNGVESSALPGTQSHSRGTRRVPDSQKPPNGAVFLAKTRKQPVRPLTATFPINQSRRSPQPRPRSSSPSPKQPASASFAAFGQQGRCPRSDTTSAVPPHRRQSWQTARKSLKQLEAEYRESDDELPDDASLWNVPMSPRPFDIRPGLHSSSRRSSPDRDSMAGGQRPLPISASLNGASPLPRHAKSHSFSRLPPPPRTSSLPMGRFAPASPGQVNGRPNFRDHRAQSWNLAMADLSEEARVLTENLELHCDVEGRQHEERVQSGITPPPRPSSDPDFRRSGRGGAVELPAIQRGHILIDPMPPSKEKEAVLTRTRPSWLPPKDPKEEKRHLQEYRRMVASSLEADRKKEARIKAQACDKDDTRQALNRIWEQYVFPDLDRLTHEHRTRELWWRGISPKLRGQVWMRAIGNPLGLSHRSYSLALRRSQDLRAKPVEQQTPRDQTILSGLSNLERDSQHIFPEHNLFQPSRGLWPDLMNVCRAYACYRADVGYRYEIQLVAATLLLQIPSSADVFILLANCLNGPLALAFLTHDVRSISGFLDQASRSLHYKLPRLHQHLFAPEDRGGLGLAPADVFEIPLRTLLSNGLDLDRLVRVWDCYVFEGEKILVRATVALLRCLQAQIFAFAGSVDERRRQIWELLGWGRGNIRHQRRGGGDGAGAAGAHGTTDAATASPARYWHLEGDVDSFMAKVQEAGKYNEGDE